MNLFPKNLMNDVIYCITRNPTIGVKSICPMSGGTIFLKIFKYGSVICLKVSHGFLSQSIFGNHVSKTLINKINV